MWPVSTMSGWYCLIQRTSSASPKYFLPPQLVGDSSGGAVVDPDPIGSWLFRVARELRADLLACCGPSHQGQIVTACHRSRGGLRRSARRAGAPWRSTSANLLYVRHSGRRDRDCPEHTISRVCRVEALQVRQDHGDLERRASTAEEMSRWSPAMTTTSKSFATFATQSNCLRA